MNPLPDQLTINISPEILLEMILVRPGYFIMGSEVEEAYNEEGPEHLVQITQSFYIGKYPVTQAQWSAIFPDHNPSGFKGSNLPVENISWRDIVDGTQENGPPEAFLTCINRQLDEIPKLAGYAFRLPTEVEWEYAAKGGHLAPQDFKTGVDTTDLYSEYAGSDELKPAGWFEDNNYESTHPVGRKQANELGLYDLSGNVDEWCADAYDVQLYRERVGKVTENPPAVEATENRPYRVLRGGSWIVSARLCRLTYRFNYHPEGRLSYYGFRLVLAPVRAGE